MIELGDLRRGLRVLEEGIAAQRTTRSTLLRPYYFVLLAGGLIRCGEYARAQKALDESAAISGATSQHAYDSEHARLQAEVLSAQADTIAAAEEHYRRALSLARKQGARWFELRAARAYSHYLIKHGRGDEAHWLLEPICAGFTEGLDTPDFQYADGLLKTLA
jgi:adenylate cyclase